MESWNHSLCNNIFDIQQMVHDSLPIISYATELSVGRRISLEL